jgi:hypothetical protein
MIDHQKSRREMMLRSMAILASSAGIVGCGGGDAGTPTPSAPPGSTTPTPPPSGTPPVSTTPTPPQTPAPTPVEPVVTPAGNVSATGVAFSEIATYPNATARETIDANLLKPPANVHPRVFFRQQDLANLNAKSTHTKLKTVWAEITKKANEKSDGKLPLISKSNTLEPNFNKDVTPFSTLLSIEAQALIYAIKGDEAAGRNAVVAVFNLHNTVVFNTASGEVYRDYGRVILTTALVYDWCYNLISAIDKRRLIARIETWGPLMECEWPTLVQNSICGHGTEAQISRDMLAAAIATYDEKPAIYTRAAGRLYGELLPARNYFYNAPFQAQGSSYGSYRYQWEIYSTILLTRMGLSSGVSSDQAKVPYHWLYTRRGDGQFLRNGDDFIEQFTSPGVRWPIYGLHYAASHYADPILMGEVDRDTQLGKDPLFDFLMFNPNVTSDPDLSKLPLTRYFDAPYGAMVARTGWDANSVVAEMKVGCRYFGGHTHVDAGNFQIYYKGPLAVNSGIYQGKNGAYGGEHHINYYQRSIAHNCMLIKDPNEKPRWKSKDVANDGGQRYPNNTIEPDNLTAVLTDEFLTGIVLARGFGPDASQPNYTYLKGDLTKAYSSKVSKYHRSFVFLNMDSADVPAVMVVLDRVDSADPSFKKTWLLHCVEEPTISGNVSTIQRVANLPNNTTYNGKLVNTTLLPSTNNLTINKIGGTGQEYFIEGASAAQGAVNSNFTQTYDSPSKTSNDFAKWRLEISPNTAAISDVFLNVIQVMNGGTISNPLSVQSTSNSQLRMITIVDRLVCFSTTGALISTDIGLNVPPIAGSEAKVLLTDIANGTWNVFDASQNVIQTLTATQSHLFFKIVQGIYTLKKI